VLLVSVGSDEHVGQVTGRIIDPRTGTATPVPLPGPGADEASVGLLSRAGGVVLIRASENTSYPVWVLSPPYREARPIGAARSVVPSNHPDRVWLVLEQQSLGADGATATIEASEVDLSGHTWRSVRFPCCRTMVADSSRGVLMQSDAGLEVWDVARHRRLAVFGGVGEIAAVADHTVVYLVNRGCGGDPGTAYVLDLVTGRRQQLGDTCSHNGPGKISPDGRMLALFQPQDGAASSLELFRLDRQAPPVPVPHSYSAEHVVTWDAAGRVYSVDDTDRTYLEALWSYDPRTGASTLVLGDASSVLRAFVAAP
jgi:hypothetical protein